MFNFVSWIIYRRQKLIGIERLKYKNEKDGWIQHPFHNAFRHIFELALFGTLHM